MLVSRPPRPVAASPRVVPSALPLAALSALAIAACGGSGSDTGANSTATPPTGDSAGTSQAAAGPAGRPACAPGNGGITLPQGFCATIFADSVGGARHVAVAPNGDVFVALMTAAKRGTESGQAEDGGVLALRDTTGDGVSDVRAYFGDLGGTGVGVAPGWVYAEAKGRIVRWPVAAGQLRPSGDAQVIVTGLPMGGHEARNFVLDGKGNLFVNVGSKTNSCQQKDRGTGSPGIDPCTELQTRAGVWRFAADRQGQAFTAQARYATGIRNAMGLTVQPGTGQVYTTQHGRDQLYQNWQSKGYTTQQSAELPAEEFMRVGEGEDFGWPYCYFDQNQGKRVLAPEYGGDGGQAVGRCAQFKTPAVAFPGHWAPMASQFYTGTQFPARYRDGVFVSFHGSWNRAPLPQAGYRVVFAPAPGGTFDGKYEDFATGFYGAAPDPSGKAAHRPVGLAQAPDGGLYVTDDAGGRIWKIVYTGGATGAATAPPSGGAAGGAR